MSPAVSGDRNVMSTPNNPLGPGPEADRRLVYHQELDSVNREITRLGALVCETIQRGTEAFMKAEISSTQALIDGDDIIDQLAVEIEERCHSILVRQAPMAGELRQVVTVVKLVAELERSADLMVNVCKASHRMHGSPMTPRLRGLITAMSKEAGRLMRLALDSYADKDANLASALADIDDELDQLNRDMISAIFEAHSSDEIDWLLRCSLLWSLAITNGSGTMQ